MTKIINEFNTCLNQADDSIKQTVYNLDNLTTDEFMKDAVLRMSKDMSEIERSCLYNIMNDVSTLINDKEVDYSYIISTLMIILNNSEVAGEVIKLMEEKFNKSI